MNFLPATIKPKAPPIKSQGIKTKLIPFIAENINWTGSGRWIEPFLGSGAVLLNINPKKAYVADTNKYLIAIYKAIQDKSLTAQKLEIFLKDEGSKLEQIGEPYYYEVRARFNETGNPFDFIFLNRACFNGVIRFNSKGGFNVPFCKKTERFRQAYVTKICNQVNWAANLIDGKDWEFNCQDWKLTLSNAKDGDFVYLDPPYVGRHTDYFNQWDDEQAQLLADTMKALPCGFAYSMWKQNQYRKNLHLEDNFSDYPCVTFEHFYHVGSTEELRNAMEEALILSPLSVCKNTVIRNSESQLLLL